MNLTDHRLKIVMGNDKYHILTLYIIIFVVGVLTNYNIYIVYILKPNKKIKI